MKKKIIHSLLVILIATLLSIFPKNNTINESVIYTQKREIPIYAVYQNKYIGRSLIYSFDDNIIEYISKVLTIGNKENDYLLNGFSPIIPRNTKLLNYYIMDDTITLNYSKEFLNIDKNNKKKLIESIVYSYLEINNIKNVKILIDKIPFTGIDNEFPNILNRSIGINKIYNLETIKNSYMVTTYFPINKNVFIPITKVTNSKKEKIEIIVNELNSSILYENHIIDFFNASYEIKEYQILSDSIKLSFDNNILYSLNNEDISEEVRYTMMLSLRDSYDIDTILININ